MRILKFHYTFFLVINEGGQPLYSPNNQLQIYLTRKDARARINSTKEKDKEFGRVRKIQKVWVGYE